MNHIPYDHITTLFLDVGGTLVGINYDRVRSALETQGIACKTSQIQRAEAAARPIVSANFQQFRQKQGLQIPELFLTTIFTQLPDSVLSKKDQSAHLAHVIMPFLFPRGKTSDLWTYVLPGVREGLRAFQELGLQLVVVSNSDGTVEHLLEEQQLRAYFDVIVDSHIVQVEKPDPEIFHIALELSGAIPESTLYVGDMYDFDVVGARAAGLHAVLLDPYADWHDVDCQRVPDLLALCANFPPTTA